MSALRRALARMFSFLRKPSLDDDLEAEIAAHIELATQQNIERGLTPIEARRQALVRFGGMDLVKDQHREARGLMKLDILFQDFKYTVRSLCRDRGFTIIAVLLLALGIGANIAVFSVINNLLLRPLPFPNADRLVWIAPPPTACGLSCATYSTDAYDEFRTHSRSYQDVTGYFAFSGPGNLDLSLGGAPIPATSVDVIANFFQVLGVQPAIGRVFRPEDGNNGAAPVIVLSDAWWRRQFNADPNIVGKAFDMNGHQTTVIGVLPATFDFGAVFSPGVKIDALTPLNLYGPPRNWGNIITLIGRLKPGVTMGQAVPDAASAATHMCWNNKQPQSCRQYIGAVVPVPLKDYISGKLRRSLVVLWSAVGGVLLIACVNLSNLLLARAAARTKEFAMRTALGASSLRIVRQLLTESLVLSGAGALCGLTLAAALIAWLRHQQALALPLLSLLHIDGAALGWTVLIAIVAAGLFGLLPGLRMASGNLQDSLKDSGAGSGQGRKHERLRSILVVTEVALACVLLVGAGLLLRSFLHVLDVDMGFEPQHAAAVNVDFDDSVPNDKTGELSAARRGVIFQQVINRVSAIPGVQAAGISDYLPLGQNRAWGLPWPKGVRQPDNVHGSPLVYVITPGFLRAMGTGIRGRDLTWDDGPKSQNVVLINRSFANFLAQYAKWPNNDAVGQIIGSPGQDLLVVGVVDDVHEESAEGDAGWQIYYSALQNGPNGAQLVVRTTLPPAELASSVLRTLRDINPKQAMAEFRPIQSLVDHANSPRQFFMLLAASFAGLGLLLAAIGIYGVISYSVTQRTQEIGIRMALGATMAKVQRSVLVKTLRLALIGIAAGAVASLMVSRAIAALLFNTAPSDPITFAAMVLLIAAVALLAGYIPARRASHINPMVALRNN
ncbi:MAG TPA: ABC transporter permease [Terracidiphilus sp.]|nr:ABC transporter permease [Terracidiphilus sp.]